MGFGPSSTIVSYLGPETSSDTAGNAISLHLGEHRKPRQGNIRLLSKRAKGEWPWPSHHMTNLSEMFIVHGKK